jgi:hypothetical protein
MAASWRNDRDRVIRNSEQESFANGPILAAFARWGSEIAL